jgi:hypothetical protein
VTDACERYAFVEADSRLGPASLAPLLPITLTGARSIAVQGLLDTGATVNVLHYLLRSDRPKRPGSAFATRCVCSLATFDP